MDGLAELSVLVSTPPGTEPERRRLVSAIEQLNATATWRYLTRYSVHADELAMPRAPSLSTLPRIGSAGHAEQHAVVVALVRGDPPMALARVGQADIERWQAAGPWLVIIEDLHPVPASDAQTMQMRNRLRALIDWAETQPRVLVAHRARGDDIGTVVGHLMADVARRGWMERNGVDRLVCRQCGHQARFERSTGRCPREGSVMVRPAALARRRVPAWIGEFPIHGVVGRGAFGKVWLSMSETRQWGALKTLVDADNAHALARLERELRLLALFDHPHIVRLLERTVVDGAPVGLLEYLPGRPLKFVIDALPPRHVLDLTLELLSALMAIHQQGIVHRDLKPGNIMLVDDPLRPAQPPRLVLLDFGLGKHEAHFQEQLTQQGMVLGTPNYMAPEQFTSAASVDGRADIYAVGVMLYMALTPDKRYPIPPPPNMNDMVALLDFIRRVQSTEPDPIDRPDLPMGIKQIVMKALARNPEDRFSSSAQMHQALLLELERWDDATIDETDASWMSWAPSAAYVAYYAQARSSTSGDVTVSSESLPATLTSSPAIQRVSADRPAPPMPPPPPVDGSPHGRSGNTARLDGAAIQRGLGVAATPRRTVVDPDPPSPGALGMASVPPQAVRRAVVDPSAGRAVPAAEQTLMEVDVQPARRWLPWAAAALLVVASGVGVALWSMRPVPTFAEVKVLGQDGSPVAGIGIVVDGRPAGVTTDDEGRARARLGSSDGGPWTVEVVVPPDLRVRGDARRTVEPGALDDMHRTHQVFEMYNPFALRNPGGSLIPVALEGDHVVILRDVRLGRIVPADRGGLLEFARGTELHACQGRALVEPGTPPAPDGLLGALERCAAEAGEAGLVVFQVKSPSDAETRPVRARVAQ